MNERRLNLDEIEERVNGIAADEKALMPSVLPSEPPTPEQRIEQLERENERLQRVLNDAASARENARQFMTLYADPRRLPDLERSLSTMLPNARAIGASGAQLVARMAVTYQLNPFIEGMIYAWVDEDDRGKPSIRVRPGYRGYLEKMKQQRHVEVLEPRPMTQQERDQHGLRDQDRGSVVEVYDLETMLRYEKMGLPYRPTIGIGIWRPDEKRSFLPKGRSGQWRSEIRAINDAGSRFVRFAIEELAGIDSDAEYDPEAQLWSIRADDPADWLTDEGQDRALAYMQEQGVTEAEVDEVLQYHWRKTWLNPDEFKELVDAVAERNKEAAIEGDYVETDGVQMFAGQEAIDSIVDYTIAVSADLNPEDERVEYHAVGRIWKACGKSGNAKLEKLNDWTYEGVREAVNDYVLAKTGQLLSADHAQA